MLVFAWIVWSLILLKYFMNFIFVLCAIMSGRGRVNFNLFNIILYTIIFVFMNILIFGGYL